MEPREGLFYVPMAIKMKQLQYEQLDDYDIRSDSTSMNSEIQDNKKKIKDVIETSEQGIQAENSADCWGNN